MADKTRSNSGTKDYTNESLPDLKGRKAFILPGAYFRDVVVLFAQAGAEKAPTVEEADFVVFTGGEDVDPILYGQRALSETYFNPSRDSTEQAVYHLARSLHKPMFGICRGAQFLHVMNGGTLWQHVENHGGKPHYIVDIESDERVLASSVHHQMVQLNNHMDLIAVCEEQVSKVFKEDGMEVHITENSDAELEIEAAFYQDTQCFFVQGHPEVGPAPYASWCMNKFFDLLVEWETTNLIRAARKAAEKQTKGRAKLRIVH